MAYPASQRTARLLIEAALVLDEALTDTDDGMVEAKWDDAVRFRDAVAAHREATGTEHVNGPNIDADGSTP